MGQGLAHCFSVTPAKSPGGHHTGSHAESGVERDEQIDHQIGDADAGDGLIPQLSGKIGVHRTRKGLQDIFQNNGQGQEKDAFSHVLAPGLEGEDTHDFSLERDPYALVTHLLYHIRDKRRDLAAIIAGGQGEGFWGPFQQWVAGPLLERMLEGRGKETLAIPYSFLAGHIANSLIYLIRWWMEQGMTATPEEMAAIFWKITNPLLSEPAQDTRS